MKSTPPVSTYNEMKRRLRARRVVTGVSSKQKSTEMGYGMNAIWFWETNRRTPSILAFIDWADALGFKLEMVPK